MPSVIVYYAHPGHRHSRANRAMQAELDSVRDITRVDLYHEYPQHNIRIEQEQSRLLAHDVIVFQFPLFWYSTPSLLKEWQDLVLEYGFAYGPGGDKLAGKIMLAAITTGGHEADYSTTGKHGCSLRTLLKPLESTAHLCQMHFGCPYVLYNSLSSSATDIAAHASGYRKLLTAITSGSLSKENLTCRETLQHTDTLVASL